MTRAGQIGVGSVVLAGAGVAFAPLNLPVDFICLFLACVLGVIAAREGSRWWLAVPATIITGGFLIFWFVTRLAS